MNLSSFDEFCFILGGPRRGGGAGAGAGRQQGGGGRRPAKPEVTIEDLNAELDAYTMQG